MEYLGDGGLVIPKYLPRKLRIVTVFLALPTHLLFYRRNDFEGHTFLGTDRSVCPFPVIFASSMCVGPITPSIPNVVPTTDAYPPPQSCACLALRPGCRRAVRRVLATSEVVRAGRM